LNFLSNLLFCKRLQEKSINLENFSAKTYHSIQIIPIFANSLNKISNYYELSYQTVPLQAVARFEADGAGNQAD
jgi:hypothetical protein